MDIEVQARDLMTKESSRAHSQARRREAEARSPMARITPQRIGKQVPFTSITKIERDVDLPQRSRLNSKPSADRGRIREATQAPQLMPQRFRLRFFGVTTDFGPVILHQAEIEAVDPSDRLFEVTWPAGAIAVRVIDHKGQFLFDRLRGDLDSRLIDEPGYD